MRYVSVCSGIEAATAAWHPLGWEPVAFSEVEPFPSAVLAHHYPDVPNLGDMTKIDGTDYRGKIDLLVGGTPCQAFSVAGLRKSLGDERGNLTMKFVELANAIEPTWTIWENVPGVLNTKDNAFGCLLAGLSGSDRPLIPITDGGWPGAGLVAGPRRVCAWRILDAQYFGVAQRRRRVFLIASSVGAGINPGAVLFEPEYLPRNTPPRREPGQGTAGDVAPSLTGSGRGVERVGESRGQDPVVAYLGNAEGGSREVRNLTACNLQKGVHNQAPLVAAYEHHMQDSRIKELDPEGPFPQLNAKAETGGGNLPLVASVNGDITHCLRGGKTGYAGSEDGTGRGTPVVALRTDVTPKWQDDISFTLTQPSPTGGGQPPAVARAMQVRRLLPVECERLQGFPDNFTNVPYGRPKYPDQICPDGHRYKALGNSMAVPCMRWIGERIQKVMEASP